MSKNSKPIYALPNGGYRIRPSLLNPYTNQFEQREFQSSKWTYREAVQKLNHVRTYSHMYFTDDKSTKNTETKQYGINKKTTSMNNGDTLDDLYQRWVDYRVTKYGTAYNEWQTYIYNTYIKNTLGNLKINKIVQKDITEWIIYLHGCKKTKGPKAQIGQPLKDKTINGIITVLMNIVKFGRKDENINFNFKIERISIQDSKYEAITWTDEEAILFLKCIDEENLFDKTLFSILFLTGIRLSECRALHPSKIDFKNKTVLINSNLSRKPKGDGDKSWVEGPTKGKDATRLSLGDVELSMLKKLISNLEKVYGYNPETFFIFGGIEPISPNYVRNHFNKYKEILIKKYPDIDIRINVHGIRHSVGTSIAASDGLLATQKQLRHADTSTSLRYIHIGVNPVIANNRSNKLHNN